MPNEEQKALFRTINIGHLTTINEDGTPQVTPVWVDLQGDQVVVNTAGGRKKVKNIRRDSRVAVEVVDKDNPYKTVSVKGRVVEVRKRGADEDVDAMAKRYIGEDKYLSACRERNASFSRSSRRGSRGHSYNLQARYPSPEALSSRT